MINLFLVSFTNLNFNLEADSASINRFSDPFYIWFFNFPTAQKLKYLIYLKKNLFSAHVSLKLVKGEVLKLVRLYGIILLG